MATSFPTVGGLPVAYASDSPDNKELKALFVEIAINMKANSLYSVRFRPLTCYIYKKCRNTGLNEGSVKL